MLVTILAAMAAKKLSGPCIVCGRPSNRIELVISHYRQCMTRFNHPLGNVDDLKLLRPSVNEVTKKNHLALRMLPNAAILGIAKLDQQSLKHRCITVDIANYVVHGLSLIYVQGP